MRGVLGVGSGLGRAGLHLEMGRKIDHDFVNFCA